MTFIRNQTQEIFSKLRFIINNVHWNFCNKDSVSKRLQSTNEGIAIIFVEIAGFLCFDIPHLLRIWATKCIYYKTICNTPAISFCGIWKARIVF